MPGETINPVASAHFRFPEVLANRGDFSATDGDIDNSLRFLR